ASAARMALADGSRRNAEVVHALGMADQLRSGWERSNAALRESQQRSADLTIALAGLSRVLRMVLQSGVLALGALLVIEQQVTAGAIIACSILSARALAPVELVISQWRTFVLARHSWERLTNALATSSNPEAEIDLPRPKRSLVVQAVTASPPGAGRASVQDIGFELKA